MVRGGYFVFADAGGANGGAAAAAIMQAHGADIFDRSLAGGIVGERFVFALRAGHGRVRDGGTGSKGCNGQLGRAAPGTVSERADRHGDDGHSGDGED